MADTKLLLMMISVLALSTIVSGLVIQSYQSWNTYGNDSYTGMCPSGYGAYCPSPKDPNVRVEVANLNFTMTNVSGEEYFVNYKHIFSGEYRWKWWNNIGYICDTEGNIGPVYIYFNYMTPDSQGYYWVNYTVNNSIKEPFTIVLHADEKTPYLLLEFKSNSIEMPSSVPLAPPVYSYSVPAGVFRVNPLHISTRYNPTTHNVIVWVDNIGGFNINQEEPFNIFGFTASMYYDYYGGIGSNHKGTNLMQVETDISVPVTTTSSSIADTLLDVIPFARPITSFLNTFMGMATFQYSTATDTGDWTGEPIIPWWIVIFVIYIPIIMIVAYAIQVLRGD